mmetsp:Transcript_42745/g.54926  ORF Transcript_42745/g.54926 Transcript_42745/m.54926 type:complete len:232 (+) Transcript_42745:327-1022(+)
MKTKGRRTTMDTNVFWGVLAAILPESIVHDRKQREAARMLGVDASVIRKGVDYRAALETGWKPIITSTHYDNVDWHPMVEWIHSEGSTIHNDHKDMVAVRQGDSRPSRLPCKEVLGLEHPRRKSLGTRSSERCAYLAQFHPRVTGNVNLKNGCGHQSVSFIFTPQKNFGRSQCLRCIIIVLACQITKLLTWLLIMDRLSLDSFHFLAPRCVVPVCDYDHYLLKKLVGGMET